MPPSDVPQGMAVFNADPILRRVMDSQRTMAHWSEFDEGGHFPAMDSIPTPTPGRRRAGVLPAACGDASASAPLH